MRIFKTSIAFFIICLAIITLIITACDKKEDIIAIPKAIFSINPPNGNTTTGFVLMPHQHKYLMEKRMYYSVGTGMVIMNGILLSQKVKELFIDIMI